ncbi:MAG: cation transporter [Clostridiales bacterium]|nr:cation transporter [Clostridiales bacterium]
MFGWLVRTFIRDDQNTGSPGVRTAYGRLAGIMGLVCNALLAAGKLIVSAASGSLSVAADAVNNLSDASSSLISLVGFKLASRPADKEHPFGHARYEYLAGLMVAVIILVVGVELFKGSLHKALNPSPVAFSWTLMAVLAASILVKLWMMAFNRKAGRMIDSQTLIAAAADSRNDVMTTAAILAASLFSHYAGIELDGWVGLAVAVFILYSGIGLVRDTLDPLLGKAPDPAFVQAIKEAVLSYPGIISTHDLLIHDYGPGRRFGSVHVEMAAEDDVISNHDVIERIERDIARRFNLHLVVHLDPILTGEEAEGSLRSWLDETVRSVHPDLSVHDAHIVPGDERDSIVFDLTVPPHLQKRAEALAGSIRSIVQRAYPNHGCDINIDKSYDAVP